MDRLDVRKASYVIVITMVCPSIRGDNPQAFVFQGPIVQN